jgi:hypothetical protein
VDTFGLARTLLAMSLFGFLGSAKAEPPPELKAKEKSLAMVLLREATLPKREAVEAALLEFNGGRPLATVEPGQDADNPVLEVKYLAGGSVFVGLMPAPVPGQEAEAHFPYSLSSFTSDGKLPEHRAHLLVFSLGARDQPPLDALMRFTTVLAALARSADAIGVYWGDAGATHTAEFFVGCAKDNDVTPRIMLWSGISRAREKGGQISYLSRGMNQLGLPDLYLVFRKEQPSDALERFYDLLAYLAKRGEAIPAGDTIGATAEERIPVRYVKSPADARATVWRVELR